MQEKAHPGAALLDAPPATPEFGAVPPAPFEPLPERLVLSSDEHSSLTGSAVAEFRGDFIGDVGSGLLIVEPSDPGTVHIYAEVQRTGLPAVQLDATVRESWLTRAAADDKGPASVVAELIRLAELPHQSTVRVKVIAG